jgi:hypothetical protein
MEYLELMLLSYLRLLHNRLQFHDIRAPLLKREPAMLVLLWCGLRTRDSLQTEYHSNLQLIPQLVTLSITVQAKP